MTQQQVEYTGIAIFMLGAALGMIKWVGRALREQLGPGLATPGDAATITHVDTVPPALVKQAIERGLVSSAQLASMKPVERQYLFASLAPRLAAPTASVVATRRATSGVQRAINGAEFGVTSLPASDRLHVHCPVCGEMLDLPAFAPYVAHCSGCGGKTSVRDDETGHLQLIVTPAASGHGRAR